MSSSKSASSSSSSNELTKKYQKKSDREHILDNPDTYIGSIEHVTTKDFIFGGNVDAPRIQENEFSYIPGLYKLFDEGIVNCRDHVIRMEQSKSADANKVSTINITITNNRITFYNDGNGIDIEQHPEYKIWIPELIFGHLRTSTNYNKNEKKIVGGKNGFGFKLVLIWSTYGSVETVDHVRKLKYVQEFRDNLTVIEKPKITKCSKKPYTQVCFEPDFKRLGIECFDQTMINLFQKRVYDVAGITEKNIKVKMNDNILKIKQFDQYVDLYIGNKTETSRAFEVANERWSYACCISKNDEFTHASFVNGIYTQKGGKHVDYVVNQITRKICDVIAKKKNIQVKPASIKEQLFVFINCTIENPAFDSQTKDYLNTPVSKFGSTCTVSDKFIAQVCKLGVIQTACALTDIKNQKQASKTDGNKCKSIRGIPKLVDANYAGTPKSDKCTLILCEGDSAKAGIISGLSKEDRNFIGVYPMKGKIMNVRGENVKKINENKEIIEIKKILGLENNKKYNSANIVHLRYGKLLFMTDQDLDGTHIKGLGLNLFEYMWPSLLEVPNFIGFMNTPILKATKNKKVLEFYNDGEYDAWKEKMGETSKGWKIKYYKGLGTSTNKEFKEYFEKKKIVTFQYAEEEKEYIDMVFNKKRSTDRKSWLDDYDRKSYLDTSDESVSYKDFVKKEMIHFSKYDCDRSIPNLMDGFKISQRKILYGAFKKNLVSEIKVAQFSGYVSENSGYHHGEASLNGAIVNMAQNYVGSNNVNLLDPNGQFGTRLQGGKDSASERYIFTKLNPVTYKIFRKDDQAILNYLDDDGFMVEPIYYLPILPMILINGAKGIGTGFSTDIPCFSAVDIIQYLRTKLNSPGESAEDTTKEFVPYYKGYKGIITKISPQKYSVSGCYTIDSKKDRIIVTELPVGTWTDDYKEYIEKCIESKQYGIKDYNDMSTDTDVNIEVVFQKGHVSKLKDKKDVEKKLKLTTTLSLTNMNLFDDKEQLTHFDRVQDIIDTFYDVRLSYYDIRKKYLLEKIQHDCDVLENKYRYIGEILEDTIDLRKKKSSDIDLLLTKKEYMRLHEKYDYLIKMPMDSVSEENVNHLKAERTSKLELLDSIKNTTIKQMWLNELAELEESPEFKKMI